MKYCLSLICLVLALLGRASESDCLMTFSTTGPDCYRDGSEVLDGEYYALVAQTASAGDVLFTLDGDVADTTKAVLLRKLPLAKDGRCPETTFSVDADALPKFSEKTCLRLYLLDTRIYRDGVAEVAGSSDCIQASVPVTGTISVSTSAVEGTSDPTQFARSELPDDAISPIIAGIDFEGDDVILTVRETMPKVNYVARHYKGEVCEGAVPATGTGKDDEVYLRMPRDGSSCELFQVTRQ